MQQRPDGSGQNLGCLIAAGVIGVSTLIAAAIVFVAVVSTGRSLGDALNRVNPANAFATSVAPSPPTIVARPPAVLQVRALNDLATAQQIMSTVVEVEKARVGDIIYERLVLIACGKVKAGINLAAIRDQDVTVEGDVVTVRLPKAELQDVYLIEGEGGLSSCKTKVYDRTNLIILPETRELESQARDKALESIRAASIEAGILNDANRNARTSIERVLLLAGYKQIVFVDP